MSKDYIDRSHDEDIIDIVRSVMDNGTGRAETPNEHILIKLMQLRHTPMTSFKFDQKQVDFYYDLWIGKNKETKSDYLYGVVQRINNNPILDGMPCFEAKSQALKYIDEQLELTEKLNLEDIEIKYNIIRLKINV